MIKALLLFILTLGISSCGNKISPEIEYYVENQTSFFELRNSDWTKNEWIRKPENLKTIHESFKKFGYGKLENLIYKSDDEFMIQSIYIKRKFENVVDSLQLTYKYPEIENSYYKEFWERRKKENNDSIVYEIICEFKSYTLNKKQLTFENKLVNDTLVDLLKIEFESKNPSLEKAKENFQLLKTYGFQQSAYNLLYERVEYSKLNLDREKLKEELILSSKYTYPWLIDTEK